MTMGGDHFKKRDSRGGSESATRVLSLDAILGMLQVLASTQFTDERLGATELDARASSTGVVRWGLLTALA